MKISSPTLAMFGVSMLALAAGVMTGTVASRYTGSSSAAGASSLSQELGLSSQQHDQMQTIWENVRTTAHQCQDQAQQLQKQRDDAVFALLTDEQKARYNKLTVECVGKIQALDAQREAAFDQGVEKTKSMLTDSQRRIYEQLLADRLGQRVSSENPGAPAVAMVRP